MKRFYILTLIISLGMATGCQDFLTEDPVMSQSDVLTLSTYEGLNKVTAATYANLAGSSWYGTDFIIINEMKTSNGKKYIGSSFDTGRLNDWYNINYSETMTSSLWGSAYFAIYMANNVIANLEGKGAEQDLNNLKAECLFLRALSHFDLVRTYAQPYSYTADASHDGVPVITTVQTAEDKPAREPVSKVYGQIVDDLLEAEEIIDPEYVRSGIKDIRASVSIYAIQALLSRVYLYMGKWQEAADYATKVIDSKEFTMWTQNDMKDAKCFCEDVRKAGSGEVIFEVYHGSGEYGGTNEGICSLTSSEKYGDAGACKDLMDLYSENDVRSTLFHSAASTTNSETVYWTAKYLGKGIAKPDYSNIIVLRLSEMYLNRAEAVINGAKGYNALDDLKVIADNRGAEAQAATLAGVYLERQKELAWEAHLWFDLGRTKRNMTRNDFVGSEGTGKEVKAGSHLWAMPIPEREHNVNGNLTHNPGY